MNSLPAANFADRFLSLHNKNKHLFLKTRTNTQIEFIMSLSLEEIEKILSRINFEELDNFSEKRSYHEKMSGDESEPGEPGDRSLSRHEAEVIIPMRSVETAKAHYGKQEL